MRVDCCTDPECEKCRGQGRYFDERCPRCGGPRKEGATVCDPCARKIAQLPPEPPPEPTRRRSRAKKKTRKKKVSPFAGIRKSLESEETP